MEKNKKPKRAEGEHTENYLKMLEKKKREATYKLYKKTEIVDLLTGVSGLPKQKVNDVFTAFCDLLVEIAHTESIVQLPKFGRLVFEPKNKRQIWNPKEGRTLLYQNPRVTFRLSYKLRSMLRKQFRRNCYQLAELNNLTPRDFKPRMEKGTDE